MISLWHGHSPQGRNEGRYICHYGARNDASAAADTSDSAVELKTLVTQFVKKPPFETGHGIGSGIVPGGLAGETGVITGIPGSDSGTSGFGSSIKNSEAAACRANEGAASTSDTSFSELFPKLLGNLAPANPAGCRGHKGTADKFSVDRLYYFGSFGSVLLSYRVEIGPVGMQEVCTFLGKYLHQEPVPEVDELKIRPVSDKWSSIAADTEALLGRLRASQGNENGFLNLPGYSCIAGRLLEEALKESDSF